MNIVIYARSAKGVGRLEQGIMNRFTIISEWIYFIFVMQILWFTGFVVGIGVLGIFPSTFALFAVFRKRLQGEDVQITKEFWQSYRYYFINSQITGWFWVILGLFLYYDIRLLFSYQNTTGFFVAAIFVGGLLLYLLLMMLIIPIYVHYDLTGMKRIRLSIMIAVTMPQIVIGLTLSTISILLLAIYMPILFLLCGISLTAYLYTKIAHIAFTKFEDSGYLRINDY